MAGGTAREPPRLDNVGMLDRSEQRRPLHQVIAD